MSALTLTIVGRLSAAISQAVHAAPRSPPR
jgi:hypothetical protein